MTNVIPTQGKAEHWLATLQEAHRYIIHYSTVRLSLVTFLVTAMFTALLYGLPKQTVVINQDAVLTFTGEMNWAAIAVAILLFLTALSLNRVFDKRRYMMERFAIDVEIVFNAKCGQANSTPTLTAREHHLDKLGEQDINAILNQTKIESLQTDYEKGYRGYILHGKPGLNVTITWCFLLVFVGIIVLITLSSAHSNRLTVCVKSSSKMNCLTSLMPNS